MSAGEGIGMREKEVKKRGLVLEIRMRDKEIGMRKYG